MRKLLFAVAALGFTAQAGAVVVPNGDFSAGYTDFTSSYTYHADNPSSQSELYPEGSFGVGTNANNYHNLWASFGDHTTGTGNYMIVNGAAAPVPVYTTAAPILLSAGVYKLSFWLASLYPTSPAMLTVAQTSVGTVTLGSNISAGSTTGVWDNFTSGSFTVTTPTAYTFSIVNANTALGGNDFGLDDISLLKVGSVPEPATWALAVAGFGLMGASMRRRRTAATFA